MYTIKTISSSFMVLWMCCGSVEAARPVPVGTPPSVIRIMQRKNLKQLITTIASGGTYVRNSVGMSAGQCFTDNDYEAFTRRNTVRWITDSLKKDRNFGSLVTSIKALPPNERSVLLQEARNTYRKTWAELNIDPGTAGRKLLLTGQTEAGSKAEKDIANGIADLF